MVGKYDNFGQKSAPHLGTFGDEMGCKLSPPHFWDNRRPRMGGGEFIYFQNAAPPLMGGGGAYYDVMSEVRLKQQREIKKS